MPVKGTKSTSDYRELPGRKCDKKDFSMDMENNLPIKIDHFQFNFK